MDQDIKTGKGRNVLYPEHLNLAAIQKGIKEGKFKQGTFLSSRENFREGYVSVPGEEKMVRCFTVLYVIKTSFTDFIVEEDMCSERNKYNFTVTGLRRRYSHRQLDIPKWPSV